MYQKGAIDEYASISTIATEDSHVRKRNIQALWAARARRPRRGAKHTVRGAADRISGSDSGRVESRRVLSKHTDSSDESDDSAPAIAGGGALRLSEPAARDGVGRFKRRHR